MLVHAVCEREPVGLSGQSCDDGGVCITLASSTAAYELLTTQMTWPDAEIACEGRTGTNGKVGGHLVIFETTDEREGLSRELAALTQAGLPELLYWVGLQDQGRSSVPSWTWENGQPVGAYPLEWGDGEPTAGTFAYGKVEKHAGEHHARPAAPPRRHRRHDDSPLRLRVRPSVAQGAVRR